MITFPCAKINLGLNITARRPDGYHNLETVFYPIPLTDALEVKLMDKDFPSATNCDLKVPGDAIACNEQDNLVVKAYNLLAADYQLPRVHAHLFKRIPSQAGLGGGSSDGAYMIRLLDERFRMNIGNAEMERYAAKLGADCPFFIYNRPMSATGIGDVLADCPVSLKGYKMLLVKSDDISVPTKLAYSRVTPQVPEFEVTEIVARRITEWQGVLKNDFEPSVFASFPQLAALKARLLECGAVYAAMSGSGSSVFGIFESANMADTTQFAEFGNVFDIQL